MLPRFPNGIKGKSLYTAMSDTTFRLFLLEEEQENVRQAQEMEAKVKEISEPGTVQRAVSSLGAKNIDDLISKLERHPKVAGVIQKYQQSKTRTEGVYGEGFAGAVFGGIWKALSGVFKWAVGSVAKTIGQIFSGFGENATAFQKINYAAALLVTFGLSGTLLATGAPLAVAAAAVPLTATPWALMWFGKNILEPALRHSDGRMFRFG